jgi:hypothetical protein
MRALDRSEITEVSGGKEPLRYSWMPTGSGTPRPAAGGGNIVALIIGILGSAGWDAIKEVWAARHTGNGLPEPILSPEETNILDQLGDDPWWNEDGGYNW